MDPKPNEIIDQPAPTSKPPPIIIPENKPKKSHKALFFLLGILIVLILVGGIGGGYYFGKNNSSSNVAQVPTPTTSQDMTGSDKLTPGEPKIDPTADWQTYENTKYLYTFKYPSNGEISVANNEKKCDPAECGHVEIHIINEEPLIIEGNNFPSFVDIHKKRIEEFKKKGSLSISGNYSLDKFLRYDALVQTINFNGKTLKSMDLIKDNTVYGFSFDKNSEIENQILSTFKFTN